MTTELRTDADLPIAVFTEWLAYGERGISSEAIVSHLTGRPLARSRSFSDYPFDPDDFRRCELLLRQVLAARILFPRMATRSPVWSRLLDAWDQIAESMEAEVPGVFSGSRPRGSAPKSYDLMKTVIYGDKA